MSFLVNLKNLFGSQPTVTRTLSRPEFRVVRAAPPDDTEIIQIEKDLQLVTQMRTYDAAVATEATYDWLAWASSGSFEVLSAWQRLTYLARSLERDNPYARSFLRELQNNVIGNQGIRLQPKVKNQKGSNLNKKLNDQITEAWKRWNKKGNCDVTREYSGIQLDELILRSLARDGGCLLRLYKGFANEARFAVQLISIDCLDLFFNQIQAPEHRITTGVETNMLGEVTAYHLMRPMEKDLTANQMIGQRIRIPANEIIHVWMPMRSDSVREVTWFAPVMTKLRHLDKYEIATSIAARAAAEQQGFFEREPGAAPYEGQGETPEGELVHESAPGTWTQLPPGVKAVSFPVGQKGDPYKDMRKEMLRSIASGLGGLYPTMAQDLENVNYSSARFGKEETIIVWRSMQRFFIESVKQRIFETWLECQVLAGTVEASIAQLDTIKDQVSWKPRGFPYINPKDDVSSSIQAIAFGLSSHSHELAELGLDREELFEELSEDKDAAERWGLVFVDPMGRAPFLGTAEDPSITGAAEAGAVEPSATPAASSGSGTSKQPKPRQ
jgi:lambda family phage portal protein